MSDYTYLGKAIPKTYDIDKLTGAARYTADISLPGMLRGRLLHSPCAHARIVGIDTSRARGLPGVKAVVTAADTPGLRMGRWMQDRPVLAQEIVRYAGEPVAAVAAVDEDTAEEAIEAIHVTYEELPATFDPREAMRDGAPIVHEQRDRYTPAAYRGRGTGNIIIAASLIQGDAKQGLAESDVIHRERYTTQAVHPGYIEPHAVVADVDGRGRATIWSSTKGPFQVRSMTAQVLDMPMADLRVIAPALGGDFGGKGTAYLEPIALVLSRLSGCPVKLVLTQEEELVSTFVRDSAFMELTLGARKDGTFLALTGEIVFDSGAYCDLIGSIDAAILNLVGPYNIPNLELQGYRVYTNNIPRGLVRAPTGPPPAFAIESLIDEMARITGLDPFAIRMKNGVQDGDVIPGGLVLRNAGLRATLAAVSERIQKKRKPKEPNRGWGVACTQWALQPVSGREGPTSSAWVKINEDGTVVLITGVTDNGGGQYGIFSQIVAEILTVPPEAVTVIAADTDCTPYEQATVGSRTTHRVGHSVRIAAEDARQAVLRLAAELLEAAAEDLDLQEGRIFMKGTPEKSLGLAAVASASLTSRRGAIIGVGEALRLDMLIQQEQAAREVDSAAYGTHAVEVEVDPETGLVTLLNYVAAHDVGFAVNPASVRGQIEGATVSGIGYALSEELILQAGVVQNPDLLDYKMPTMVNTPPIESVIVEVPAQYGPYGAKGIGEPPTIPVAPAVANAIFDAVGVRITDLPATPEKIAAAIRAADAGTGPRD